MRPARPWTCEPVGRVRTVRCEAEARTTKAARERGTRRAKARPRNSIEPRRSARLESETARGPVTGPRAFAYRGHENPPDVAALDLRLRDGQAVVAVPALVSRARVRSALSLAPED